MNILLAPNNYYVMPTIVLLQSLFETAEEKLDIYVIHSDLAEENIRRFDRFVTKHGGAFHEIRIDDSIFDKAHTSIHITKHAITAFLPSRCCRKRWKRSCTWTVISWSTSLYWVFTICPLWERTEKKSISSSAKVPVCPKESGQCMRR